MRRKSRRWWNSDDDDDDDGDGDDEDDDDDDDDDDDGDGDDDDDDDDDVDVDEDDDDDDDDDDDNDDDDGGGDGEPELNESLAQIIAKVRKVVKRVNSNSKRIDKKERGILFNVEKSQCQHGEYIRKRAYKIMRRDGHVFYPPSILK